MVSWVGDGEYRQASLPFLMILLAAAMAGCGGGPAGVVDERDGSNEAPPGETAGREETAAPGEDRPEKPQKAPPPRAVSLGGAYSPAGFGENSLWATDITTCNDTRETPPPGGYDDGVASATAAACADPASMSLSRLEPKNGD